MFGACRHKTERATANALSSDASADEMVLEFLRAEVDSPRFGSSVADGLAVQGTTRRELIDDGDPEDAGENVIRRAVLKSYRGYPDRDFFKGFPSDAVWTSRTISFEELKSAQYLRIIEWMQVSSYTRLVGMGARAIANDDIESIVARYGLEQSDRNRLQRLATNVRGVASEYQQGKRYPSLIAVQLGPDTILMEGHTRATGFALSGNNEPVKMLLGCSQKMSNWVPLTETIF